MFQVQIATLQQRCKEVSIVDCNCNVVATLLQLQILNSIFGCIRCSLQRCSDVATIGRNCNVVATLLQSDIFNSIFGSIRCSLQRCIEVAGIGYKMQRCCNVAFRMAACDELAIPMQRCCNVACWLGSRIIIF